MRGSALDIPDFVAAASAPRGLAGRRSVSRAPSEPRGALPLYGTPASEERSSDTSIWLVASQGWRTPLTRAQGDFLPEPPPFSARAEHQRRQTWKGNDPSPNHTLVVTWRL